MHPLVRSAALGAASGLRSTAAPAGVALFSPADAVRSVPRPLAALVLAGELVVDKLPRTGSRLRPAGLAPRVAGGAAVAGAMARRRRDAAPLLAAGCAGLAALTTARIGHDVRVRLGQHSRSRIPALAEDVCALGLVALALI